MKASSLSALGLFALSLVLLPPVTSGCDGDEESCAQELDEQQCFDMSCAPEGPTRSLRTDVLPILEQSCSLASSCHGDPASPGGAGNYRPYLGETNPETIPSDVALILAKTVSQPSPTADGMPLVDPGKPENSFLMHKMDGDLSCAAVSCSAGCGTPMPQTNDVLPRETRDVIRDWIRQGAADN